MGFEVWSWSEVAMRFKQRERERMGEIFLKRVENDIYNRDRENTSVWESCCWERRELQRERERDLQMKERNGGEWIIKKQKKEAILLKNLTKWESDFSWLLCGLYFLL